MTELEIKFFLSLFPENLMHLSVKEQQISLLIYRLLVKGKPVSYEDLAAESGTDLAEIKEMVGSWGSEVLLDEYQNICGFFGLNLSKTPHILEIEDKTLYTWCAWDTLFIPSLIKKTVNIKSKCLVTKQDIELSISPSGILKIEPESTVLSLIAPDPKKISKNVIGTFCCHIHFFSSSEVGNNWAQHNRGTYIVSVEHAYHLGIRKNKKRYPDVFDTA